MVYPEIKQQPKQDTEETSTRFTNFKIKKIIYYQNKHYKIG